MKLCAGDYPIMEVLSVWHPFKTRAFRVLRCRQGDWRIWALGHFRVEPGALVTLEKLGPIWALKGVLR